MKNGLKKGKSGTQNKDFIGALYHLDNIGDWPALGRGNM